MGLTAPRLKELGLVDTVISEPLGGAHRDIETMARTLREGLITNLAFLKERPTDKLLEERYARLMSYGNFAEA